MILHEKARIPFATQVTNTDPLPGEAPDSTRSRAVAEDKISSQSILAGVGWVAFSQSLGPEGADQRLPGAIFGQETVGPTSGLVFSFWNPAVGLPRAIRHKIRLVAHFSGETTADLNGSPSEAILGNLGQWQQMAQFSVDPDQPNPDELARFGASGDIEFHGDYPGEISFLMFASSIAASTGPSIPITWSIDRNDIVSPGAWELGYQRIGIAGYTPVVDEHPFYMGSLPRTHDPTKKYRIRASRTSGPAGPMVVTLTDPTLIVDMTVRLGL